MLKSPSIFNDYFNSISNDIDNNKFFDNIYDIMQKARTENNALPEFDFIDENDADKFLQMTKEQEKEDTEEIKQFCLSRYGVKTENMKEFEKLFNQFEKEAQKNGDLEMIIQKFEELKYTKPINMEMIKAAKTNYIPLPDDFVFEDMDWSKSRKVFDYLSFNDKTFSNTSKEHLPAGYDPKTVFDKGKTIGLGINEVHNMGYTGKGVSYAIIDSGTLDDKGRQHNDIHFKEYHVSDYADKNSELNHFHGRAVSYIAQEIAPDAECYYYAQHNGFNMDAPVLDNLKQIIQKNKTLPDNQKIRFVSMSMPLYGGKEAEQIVKELEAQGVWVYYSGSPEDSKFGYLTKKDPMGNSEDFNNYQISTGGASIITAPDGKQLKLKDETGSTLFVNSGNRTVPDTSSPDAYRHDSRASQSWSVPVIAGYYTLACQADPSMTKEKFLELAEKTAQIKTSAVPMYNAPSLDASGDDMTYAGMSDETHEIKIIDIKALIQALEAEKTKSP